MTSELSKLCIMPADSLRQAMACINSSGKGIALVIDENRRLLGTISDGDIRRMILAESNLDESVNDLLIKKQNSPLEKPVKALEGSEQKCLLDLMHKHAVSQIPIVDNHGCLVDLVTWEELIFEQKVNLDAVIMAGGFGTRLRPLTDELPKPMLPLGEKPLIERTIIQLRDAGIKRINISVHYKPEKIIEHFGNGQGFGLDVNYVNEDHPLGTAGALGLMDISENPLLVINGDIVTEVNFQTMYTYHREHSAELTVAVRRYEYKVPYGVMESDGPFVQAIREKPSYNFFVNAGIYLLEPSVYQYIPVGEHFNMTDLIEKLIANNEVVVNFPIIEYWLDIGRHEDYEQAQADVRSGKVSI